MTPSATAKLSRPAGSTNVETPSVMTDCFELSRTVVRIWSPRRGSSTMHHPPLEALRRWFDQVAEYARLKYGVSEVIRAATDNGREDEFYGSLVAAIALLRQAGAAQGELKSDVDPEDVLLQLSLLWRIDPANGTGSGRIVGLIVDGLLVRSDQST